MAPAAPPSTLMTSISRSETPPTRARSVRVAHVLVIAPGTRATVLEAFAATEGKPAKTRAGNVTNEPPPAMAFIDAGEHAGRQEQDHGVHARAHCGSHIDASKGGMLGVRN